MKGLLIKIAFLLLAFNASAQITSTGGQVYLRDGDLYSLTNPTICVSPNFVYETDSWRIRCNAACGVDSGQNIEFIVTLTATEIDAFTGTGTETGAIIMACELAIIDYLESIAANAAITFSN